MDLVESGVWGDTGVGKEAVDEGSEIAGAWGMKNQSAWQLLLCLWLYLRPFSKTGWVVRQGWVVPICAERGRLWSLERSALLLYCSPSYQSK